MSDEVLIPLSDLAAELGMDRSHLRKYVIKHGFALVQIRTPESRGQPTLALSQTDAEAVGELRRSQGFIGAGLVENGNGAGYFYIVQVVPDLDPLRVKLGFAADPAQRLSAYRTLSPTAQIAKVWPCRSSWESTAMDSMTRAGCRSIGGEVFQCDCLESLVERGDAFFVLMPDA